MSSQQFDQWDRYECPHCLSTYYLTEKKYPIIQCTECGVVFFAHDIDTNSHFFSDGEVHKRPDLDEECDVTARPHQVNGDYRSMFE